MSKSIVETSYVVAINKELYPNVKSCLTPEEFIKRARDGFEVDGDLFFYIPDFREKEYTLLLNAIQDVTWFAYSKEEIPIWANENTVDIFPMPTQQAQTIESPFVQQAQPTESPFMQQAQVQQPVEQSPFKTPSSQNLDNPVENNQNDYENPIYEAASKDVKNLLDAEEIQVDNNGDKEARILLYGSSKGGTGKTFTCLISAYRYCKIHPGQKVALLDADITDPQVAIAIHKINPTLFNYWKSWSNGNKGFEFMEACKTQNSNFPANLDFYLAPKDFVINNTAYWSDVLSNLICNYDVLFIDSGIDYINIPLISYCYKVADRIILVSTTSIKSTSSVLKQINRLKGKIPSTNSQGKDVYFEEDNIGPKLRLAITGFILEDKQQNETILDSFKKNIKIGALFGYLSRKISRAEFFGEWSIFDSDSKFNSFLDRLVDPDK